MFWMNENKVNFKLSQLSIITKLMLFYFLATTGLLSAIGMFLYPTFTKVTSILDANSITTLTQECYNKVVIALLLTLLSTLILGYLIAKSGLNRMRDLEIAIDKISADTLHQRLDIKEWPKELKYIASKFNRMLDRMQKSFNQLIEFSSDIAHELRTPINNLMLTTELALTNNKFSHFHNLLETQLIEYQHLNKLIENLLFLAKLDHGEFLLKKEPINLKKEINNICDYYQASALEKNISLTCTGDALLLADNTLLKRVIHNLISNAIKYTNDNGKIDIQVQNFNNFVTISFKDSGIGIEEQHLNRLFDRFYRVDQSRSFQSGGLGLGLSIVKSIIELHNGRININSVPQEGTLVIINMPR